MGYLWRRVIGYVVFLAVLGGLSTLVVDANDASGGTLLTGTGGAVAGLLVLFLAFLSSWIVRFAMRRHSKLRRRGLMAR